MSEGLIALFEGTHFWHVPLDLRIEVGPTTSIPLPKKYSRTAPAIPHKSNSLRLPAAVTFPLATLPACRSCIPSRAILR